MSGPLTTKVQQIKANTTGYVKVVGGVGTIETEAEIKASLGILPVTDFTEYSGTSTHHYFGGLVDGEWKINRYAVAAPSVKESATELNNDVYTTLANAWTARESLTYE